MIGEWPVKGISVPLGEVRRPLPHHRGVACEWAEDCGHDLVRGVLVTDLLSGDGPEEWSLAHIIRGWGR